MKKISSFVAIAVLALCMVSCGNRAPKAEVEEQVDTVEVVVDSTAVDSTAVEVVEAQ